MWKSDNGAVEVDAVAVHHEPVADAVAYRVATPTGVVVISGDTRVCAGVEAISAGADVLVHEACRATTIRDAIRGTSFEPRVQLSRRYGCPRRSRRDRATVPHLVLTHLIPPPGNNEDSRAFATDVRSGGYTGAVTVGTDLFSVEIDPLKQQADRKLHAEYFGLVGERKPACFGGVDTGLTGDEFVGEALHFLVIGVREQLRLHTVPNDDRVGEFTVGDVQPSS